MATKTSDLLNALPSVSDLLDKPPVRALVNRWNRSMVAAGVRSFLDELRSDVQRRAAGVSLPSIRELAERAARHVLELQQPSLRPAINATGRLRGTPWSSVPLADAALERMLAIGRDFVRGPASAGSASPWAADAAALVCRVTGAQAATVVHSYSGAVWLTMAAIAAGKEVVVSRGEWGDVEPGCTLSDLGASSSAVLREVGTTNRVTAADYEAAITPRTSAVLKLSPDGYHVVGDIESVDVEELVAVARERELTLCDVLGAAPLVDHPATNVFARRSARASLAKGADLVIVRGDGLAGGPSCGIIAGRCDVVRRIEEHPLFAMVRLDPLGTAALVATLELYDDPQHLDQSVPVIQLLGTPLENLRLRAERLAPQLAQASDIAAAEPVAVQSRLGIAAPSRDALPSFGVALTPLGGDVAALDDRCGKALPPVVGRVEGERLVLDLRTVFPRQDQQLVEALVQGAVGRAEGETPSAACQTAIN